MPEINCFSTCTRHCILQVITDGERDNNHCAGIRQSSAITSKFHLSSFENNIIFYYSKIIKDCKQKLCYEIYNYIYTADLMIKNEFKIIYTKQLPKTDKIIKGVKIFIQKLYKNQTFLKTFL